MAPMTLPSTQSGNPPSSGKAPGSPSKAVRPPATASSKTFVGRLNAAAVPALRIATSTLPYWVPSRRAR